MTYSTLKVYLNDYNKRIYLLHFCNKQLCLNKLCNKYIIIINEAKIFFNKLLHSIRAIVAIVDRRVGFSLSPMSSRIIRVSRDYPGF